MQLKSHLSNTPHQHPSQTLLPAPLSSDELLQEIDIEVALLSAEVRDIKAMAMYCTMDLLKVIELQQAVRV